MTRGVFHSAALALLLGLPLCAQSGPGGYAKVSCLKVPAGRGSAFTQAQVDSVRKVVQAEADQGDISGWLLLRTVFPEGQEARCDYFAISYYDAIPPAPGGPEHLVGLLKRAGLDLTADAFRAQLAQGARIVSTEMWRSLALAGVVQKGDYLYMNFMKVHDVAAYTAWETGVWKPMGEAWVKDGTFHAWFVMVPFLPSGSGMSYQLISADVFPTWEKAFQGEDSAAMFKAIHPDMKWDEAMVKLNRMRDLDRRYFLTVQEKIVPARK